MVVLEPNAMPPPPPPPKNPSMFSSLMNTYKAQSDAIMRVLWGDNDDDNGDLLCGRLRPTKTKQRRTKYPCMNQKDSLWWIMFLVAPKRNEVMVERNGRLATKFRKLFHVPFQVFLQLRDIANEEFWTEWTEDRKCRAGKLLFWQPVTPNLFAAPALTSVKRCIGLF